MILVSRKFFSEILISKMDVKLKLRLITENRAADPEIGFLIKSISKPYGRATAMPTAWEFILLLFLILSKFCNLFLFGILFICETLQLFS